jgi:hypothetical protein
MRVFTDKEPAIQPDTPLGKPINLAKQRFGIYDHRACDYTYCPGSDRAAWQKVQREFVISHDYGMACVGAAIVSNDNVAVLGKDIDNLTLAFIAPLQTYHTPIHTRPLQ